MLAAVYYNEETKTWEGDNCLVSTYGFCARKCILKCGITLKLSTSIWSTQRMVVYNFSINFNMENYLHFPDFKGNQQRYHCNPQQPPDHVLIRLGRPAKHN